MKSVRANSSAHGLSPWALDIVAVQLSTVRIHTHIRTRLIDIHTRASAKVT